MRQVDPDFNFQLDFYNNDDLWDFPPLKGYSILYCQKILQYILQLTEMHKNTIWNHSTCRYVSQYEWVLFCPSKIMLFMDQMEPNLYNLPCEWSESDLGRPNTVLPVRRRKKGSNLWYSDGLHRET